MSRYIVFERTGEPRAPKAGELIECGCEVYIETTNDEEAKFQILRCLPDAEVEALEAKADDLLTDARAWREHRAKELDIVPTCNQLLARAEKGEAEWDELTAEVRRLRVSLEVAGTGYRDALAENERLKAQLDGRYDADTRARFERETAARLLPMIWNAYEGKDSGWQKSAVGESVTMARMLADEVFAPAAVKADAPPEPWTPKKGDAVRCKLTGIVGPAIDDEQFAVDFEDFILDLKPTDLELVRRAEDAK